MKKKFLGVIAILLICAIPYVLWTGKSLDGVELGPIGMGIVIVVPIWFTYQILFDKVARQRRIDRCGSSNFFVALFKENKIK